MGTIQEDTSTREPQYMTSQMHHRAGEAEAQAHAQPELVIREEGSVDAEKRAAGIKNIVSGAVLIGIGFAFGGSVFLGNPGLLDWVCDGLGSFWVCKGAYEAITA